MTETDVDVLIVGGGPVGLTARALLHRWGISTMLIEKHSGLSLYPRSRLLNVRTMEIYRQLGLDKQITARAFSPDYGRVRFRDTMSEPDWASAAMVGINAPIPDSPVLGVVTSQDRLEPILLSSANTPVRYGVELLELTEDPDAAVAWLRDHREGTRTTIRARYVLACDGANSSARRLLNIDTTGPGTLGSFTSVVCNVDLTRWSANEPAGVYFTASGMIGPVYPEGGWVWFTPTPPDPENADWRHLVSQAISPQLTQPIEVVRVQHWQMNAFVAERFARGRVLLAGDAAHAIPPIGGLGLNTGIADVHNLCWKLAGVLQGWAGPGLLESYQAERLPVAHLTLRQSVANSQLTTQAQAARREQLRAGNTAPERVELPWSDQMAAIAWSIDQLDPADRALILRLWPFEHGLTWTAIDAVTPSDSRPAVLASLASLVDRSVILSEVDHDQTRYRMLQTVRHYCRTVDPDPAATREAHAAWARATARDNAILLEGPRATEAIQTLRAELPNIRAAIHHDLQHQPIEALRTASCLELAWVLLGHQVEGTQLIRAALDACPLAAAEDQAAGLLALSFAASHGGAAATGVHLADAALELLGEPSTAAQAALHLRALHFRGAAVMDLGDLPGARDAVGQLRNALDRMPAPPHLPALHLLGEGMLGLMERDPAATDTLRRARAAAQDCGSLWIEGLSDWLRALELLDRAPAQTSLARDALTLLNRALGVFRRQDNVCDILATLYHGAHALALLDHPDIAAQLHAAVVQHGIRTGTNPRRYARLASPFTQQRTAEIQQRWHHHTDQARAPTMTWDDMLELFTTSATHAVAAPERGETAYTAMEISLTSTGAALPTGP